MSLRRVLNPRDAILVRPGQRAFTVGLDVSLTATGLVILNHDGDVVAERVLKTTPKQAEWERQEFIATTAIKEVLASCALADVCNVFIEGYSMGGKRNGGKLFTRAEIVGQIKRELIKCGCNVYTTSPQSLKAFVWGKGGKVAKFQMRAAVRRRWKRVYDDDNLADAYGLAQFARAVTLERQPLAYVCIYRHRGELVTSHALSL